MKNLFYLSVILFSAHYILAQTSIRAQETTNQVIGTKQGTGYRVQGSAAEMAELPLDLSFQIEQQVEPTTNYNNQVTGCRLKDRLEVIGYRLEMPLQRQEMEDRRWKMEVEAQGCSFQEVEGRYNFIDNQSSFLENGSDPIFYLPSSISYLGITPKLMMDPAGIEEAEKVLKKELGISEEKISPVKASECIDSFTDSAHAKNATAFSASHSLTDPVLKNQTERAIEKTISNSLTQLQDHYKKADEAWTECNRGWKEQSQLYHELQTSRQQLTLSEQKLEQASKATTSEELEKTRLGKIAKYAGIAGDALGQVPEPHAQMASVGISKLGGIADTINSTWAKVNLVLAKREHQLNSECHARAQERETQQRQQILPLEQRAHQLETLATTQAEQSTKALAEQLHPQTKWQESQWQAWGNLIAPTWKEQDKHLLINQARLNPNLVEGTTKKYWEQKIETGKEQYTALQKKANLATLKRQYDSACQQHQRAQTQEEQQQRLLDQSQNSIENLKLEIEKRVEELEKLETRDKVQFERKKKEFIEKLGTLEKTQLRSQGLQKKWEEAVQRTSTQDEQRWTTSKVYQNAKEEAERTLARVKKACQTDRELLQKIWLKSATSNYKEWSLPEIGTPQTTENIPDSFEETRKSEEYEPPIQRLEEIEARGRNLRLREAMMNSSITGMGKNSVIGAIQNLFSKQPSLSKQTSYLYPSQSNLDQVKEWVQKKQEHPSAQDEERWGILEKLDQLQKEITAKIKAQQEEESFLDGEQYHGKDVIDEKEDDGKSSFSTATTQTASSQAMSMVSVSKSSILSFGGRSLFNRGVKVQPEPSLAPINEENKKPQEKLSQLQTQANDLKERYFTLLAEAEKERLSPQGQKNATPFSEESDCNYVWEKADRKSVEKIQQKRREQEREQIAQEEQERWQTNTERWRIRAQADQALKIFRRAQEHTITLGEEARKAKTTVQLAEARRKKEEAFAEEEKLQQSYSLKEGEWEKIAQEYCAERSERSVAEEDNNRLKERDQAVNRRWEQLQNSYQNPGVEKSAVEQESMSEVMMALEGQLEQAYQESFITYTNQEALAHYKEVAFKRALENARSYPEEMAGIWEQIGGKKENLPASQQEINQQAVAVFKEEVRRLEKIEKIWKGILEREQEEEKERGEQAAQEYYRGNRSEWNALSEQEQTRYNNEIKKANEEYEQKREGKETRITLLEKELEEIGKQLEDTKNKHYWLPNAVKKRDQQQLDLEEQKIRLENEKKRVQEELHQQEVTLNLGKRARQKESYYRTLSQVQNNEEKAKEEKNPHLKQAAEYYRNASIYWQKAAHDKTLEIQQKQSEQVAASYERAAEACEKAAQEHTALLTTHNKSKEILMRLYSESAKLYEQLAVQQEKEESGDEGSGTYDIQETLQQLEKKIERYLGTEGAQIIELQENISFLKKSLEELTQEIITLHQQSQEAVALKKEQLSTSLCELIESCQKALEGLLQESPKNSERATAALTAIQSYKIKEQQFQQTIQQVFQLEALMVPLEQRASRLQTAITASKTRGEEFLLKGQESVSTQLTQTLEQAKRIHNQLFTETQEGDNTVDELQVCMNRLQALEAEDQHIQDIASQLQQLDQNKKLLTIRLVTLKEDIKIASHEDEGVPFLIQGQEKLLMQASVLLSEINQIGEQLLAKNEKASEQVNEILAKSIQFQQQAKEFEENATFLKELEQKKKNLQKRTETLKKEIIVSENREEKLLGEAQQQLFKEIGQILSAIEQTTHQIIVGAHNASHNSSKEDVSLLNQVKQFEERDQSLQKNAPILLALEKKRNFFQNRLKDLTAETGNSKNNENKTYFHEGQESLSSEITQALTAINQSAKKIIIDFNESFVEAKALLAQLEQLIKRDQQLHENAPDLEKLNEKKISLQNRLKVLKIELKTSENRQGLLVHKKQQLFANEIEQRLAELEQITKQVLLGTVDDTGKILFILEKINILEQRDQRLQECFTQLRELIEKESALKMRAESLKNKIVYAENQSEISLIQAQKILLEDIRTILQQTSETAQQVLAEDKKTSETASQSIKELLPLLEQLERRDEQLQENDVFLRDLEYKKNRLQERMKNLKNEITSSQNTGETLLAQQQQTLSENFQAILDQMTETAMQLMQGADHALEQAQTLFNEIAQLQQRDGQLQKNIIKIQELEQKKTMLQELCKTSSREIIVTPNQEETFIVQDQQVSLDKITQLLSRIDETKEQLRKDIIGTVSTTQQVNALLADIRQLGNRDLTGQIKEAKQASKEKQGGVNAYIWDRIVTKLEQSQESWNKFTEILDQGKKEKAIFWKQAAEASEDAAEGIREAIKAYISGQEEVAQNLEKERWPAYYLSDASTWLLKSEEALEKSHEKQGQNKDFWKNLAEQYKVAANYERKASEAHAAGKEREEYSWVWAGRSAHACAGYKAKAIGAQDEGKEILAIGYREAVTTSEWAEEQYQKALQAYVSGKENEGDSWYQVGKSLQAKADYQVKACEAQEVSKTTIAASYREIAETSQKEADQWKLLAQAYTAGKINDDNSSVWSTVGQCIQKKASFQVKAIEAEEAGKLMLAVEYRKAAEILQRAIDQLKQSAQVSNTEQKEEWIAFGLEAGCLLNKGDYLVKAIKAEEEGKGQLAVKYREVTETLQKAADQLKLSVQAYTAGKKNEGGSWYDMSESLCQKGLYQAKTAEANEASKESLMEGYKEAAETLQKATDQFRESALAYASEKEHEGKCCSEEGFSLQAMTDYQVKACEAQEAGKSQIVTGYREAAKILQEAANGYHKSAKAFAAGKEVESACWNSAAKSFQSEVDYYKKEIEARETGNDKLATDYREVATTLKHAGEQYKLAAKAFAAGKKDEGDRSDLAANSFQSQVNYHKKAIEAEEEGQSYLTTGYREAAATSEKAANQYKQSALACVSGKKNEGSCWYNEGLSLQAKADYQAKKGEAKKNEEYTLVLGYREAIATLDQAEEHYQKSLQAYTAKKENEGNNWYQAGKSLQAKADYQAKVSEAEKNEELHLVAGYRERADISQKIADYQLEIIKAEKAGKKMLETGYREAAETLQRAVDQHNLLVQARTAGRVNESNSWFWAVKSFQVKADYQVKASEAREVKKEKLAAGYKKAVTTLESPEEQYQKSAKAYSMGEIDEGNSWFWSGRSFHAKADYQAKACEVQEKGAKNLAAAYQEAAEISQRAANQYKLAAQAHATKKQNEGWGLEWTAKSLQAKADYQAKASEAQEAGKADLSVGYREAATTLENTEEQYQKSAKAYSAGKIEESNSWYSVGRSFYAKADYQAKACEAQEAGKVNLANGYKEAVITFECIKEQYKKSAQAYNEEKRNEGISWYNAGISLQAKPGYEIKAIEAEETGKVILAAGYREAAATSQRAADQYKLAAQTHMAKKQEDGWSLEWSAKSLLAKANYQAKASEAEEAEKSQLAVGYREAAVVSQRAADQFRQSVQDDKVENEAESAQLFNLGRTTLEEADAIAKRAEG